MFIKMNNSILNTEHIIRIEMKDGIIVYTDDNKSVTLYESQKEEDLKEIYEALFQSLTGDKGFSDSTILHTVKESKFQKSLRNNMEKKYDK